MKLIWPCITKRTAEHTKTVYYCEISADSDLKLGVVGLIKSREFRNFNMIKESVLYELIQMVFSISMPFFNDSKIYFNWFCKNTVYVLKIKGSNRVSGLFLIFKLFK